MIVTSTGSKPRSFHPIAAALLTACVLLASTPTPAADVPDGIPVGPWILAPSLSISHEADSNVFFEQDDNASEDQVTTFEGELAASLPFRNSMLELEYSASKESYVDSIFARDVSQVLGFDLAFDFKTGDQLSFRDVYRRDFARSSEVDPGQELVTFRGEPYNINRWEAELSRTDRDRQGYRVLIRRQDFIFDGEQDIGFFEYRGFHNVFEYHQPLPDARHWVVRYETRRFNHYDPSGNLPVGVPFRKERTDSMQLGLRGQLGDDQPYRLHLGFARFRYEGEDAQQFDGIVGQAGWILRLGRQTKLDIEIVRRPLPSNSSTYYINNAIRTDLVRKWLDFEGGADLEFTKNNYAEFTDEFGPCSGKRQDATYKAEAYWGWQIHRYLELEFSGFYAQRNSTCGAAEYTAAGFETGISVGF